MRSPEVPDTASPVRRRGPALVALLLGGAVLLSACASAPVSEPAAGDASAAAPTSQAGGQGGSAGQGTDDPAGAATSTGEPGTGTGGAGTSPGAPAEDCPSAADLTPRQRLQQTIMIWVDGGATELPGVVTIPDVLLGGVFVGGGDAGLADGMFVPLAERRVPPLVAVDEEGGQVQRIDGLAGDIPSARDQAATMTPQQVAALARQRGERLAELGVTIDFAPVVDLDDGPVSRVIGERSYSADAATATVYAGAFARGLQAAGIIPTLKHFPGHGRAEGDSHAGLPLAPDLASLERRDLKPYVDLLATLPAPVAVMVGHLRVPGLTTGDTPSSVDPATYAYLRDVLGFTGPAITDELSGMQAVSDRLSTPEAVEAALAAGADLVLLAQPGDLTALLDHLEGAVVAGRLPQARVLEAADRVLSVKACPAG